MAPAKRICGNQIKVAPQQEESVVEGIKIKLAPLLVANFVIICCQLPLPVYACVCVFWGTCALTIRRQIEQTTATRPHVPQWPGSGVGAGAGPETASAAAAGQLLENQ